jgi:hypothetical protein
MIWDRCGSRTHQRRFGSSTWMIWEMPYYGRFHVYHVDDESGEERRMDMASNVPGAESDWDGFQNIYLAQEWADQQMRLHLDEVE